MSSNLRSGDTASCCCCVTAAQVVSPAWLAESVHVPDASALTLPVSASTVHTPGVRLL